MNSNLMLFETSDVASTYGNYPNPFHPETGSTTIEFNLANPTAYSLVIYDILGKRVKTFQSNGPQTGLQQLSWDGKNDAGVMVLSGIYFGELNAGGTYTLKIAVAK
jgi:flagellar hook assembly protein FlgD